MSNLRTIGVSFLLVFISFSVCSQQEAAKLHLQLGPKISHISRRDFNANEQFYCMAKDDQGMLYFGNNDGVLVYDGERWHKVSLPNNSSVTSLVGTKDGKIYAGGYNEIGQIKKSGEGVFYFESLREQLQLEDTNIENLWQVHAFKDFIIYRSFSGLIVISGQTVTHIKPNNIFSYSGIVNNHFYVMDYGGGLMEFDPNTSKLHQIIHADNPALNFANAFLPSGNEQTFYLTTKSGKIFEVNPERGTLRLWKNIFDDKESDELTNAIKYKDQYLIATQNSKIIVVEKTGEVIKNHPAYAKIFPSSIVSLFEEEENLWVLTNNGLDYVDFGTPDFHLFDEATVYDILIEDDRIYLATNEGVYFSDFDAENHGTYSLEFQKIENMEGPIWSVQKLKGDVIVSGHSGLFCLKNNMPVYIGEQDSFWKIIAIPEEENKFLAASYNGLYLLERQKQGWVLKEKVKGFDESCRDILRADGKHTYWVCHGYKGVYRLKLTDDYTRVYVVEHFTDQNGLDSPFNINVARWNEAIVFTTNTGIFSFDDSLNQFVPYKPLNEILGKEKNTRKLLEEEDRTWFVLDDEIGYFELSDKDLALHKNLFLNLKGKLNRGMESLLPIENERILIGANDGLYLYHMGWKNMQKTFNTKITGISYSSKETENIVSAPIQEKGTLPYEIDVLRFDFSAPKMSISSQKQYQFILEGMDSKWSNWSHQPFKEYTYIHPGAHTFKVRSRNMIGQLGEVASYHFVIPSKWYQTKFAYVGYVLAFLVISFTLFYLVKETIKKKIKKEKETAESSKRLLELEIEQLKLKQDSEQIQAQKDQLEEDIIAQSKELANYTILLVKKKEIITEIYEQLKEFRSSLTNATQRNGLQDILYSIKQHRIGEEYMKVFDVNFEKVHVDFFKKLMALNPELTQRELRICAFVKMNLTNKEIAPLLNISVRGVETGRYRIRKKLNVQEKNFKLFLEEL